MFSTEICRGLLKKTDICFFLKIRKILNLNWKINYIIKLLIYYNNYNLLKFNISLQKIKILEDRFEKNTNIYI